MLGISDYWAFVAAVLVVLALPGAAATMGVIAGDQAPMCLAAAGA